MAATPCIVAITGASGSGKTSFAARLDERLGSAAVVLAHDDYYKHKPEMTYDEALVYDFDCPEALDTHLLVDDLRALKAGHAIEAPSYDFAAHARTDGARHIEPASVILVEGLLIMCIPELRELFDLVIFMDGDPDTLALRRIRRDCHERGTDLNRAINMYLNTAKPAFEKYVAPFRKEADIVIEDSRNPRALELVAQGLCGMSA